MAGDLEHGYARAAVDMLASHLRASGIKADAAGDRVATGIGSLSVTFRVDDVKPAGDHVQMVFWATLAGLKDMAGSPIVLDMLGLGDDAEDALRNGVHALLDGVLPAVRRDVDHGYQTDGLVVAPVTTVTGRGRAQAWDLILAPVAIGGGSRERIDEALRRSLLFQGIMDSVTSVLGRRTGHWFKLFLAKAPDGSLHGDMSVDGVRVGVAPSFASADWTGIDSAVIRQFGLLRPVVRPIDPAAADRLRDRHQGGPERAGLLDRILRRR